MSRKYQVKFLPDGTLNPKFKPDTRKRTKDRHKPGRKHSGSSLVKDTFIAIDGEGYTTNRLISIDEKTGKPVYEHVYALLMASTGEKIMSPNGLMSQECFDFLTDLGKTYPGGIFVCFGASYDINMMLKDVPKHKLDQLWQGEDNQEGEKTTDWGLYSFSYRPRKQFIIRKMRKGQWRERTRNGKTILQPVKDSCNLWDVFGFFQTKFVDALESWFSDYLTKTSEGHKILTFPDGLTIDLTHMTLMKNARNSFTQEQLETEIVPYCQSELQALVRLMERLREYISQLDITLSRWDGAGAIAGALLKKYGVKEAIKEERVDRQLLDAQLCAYSGGRIELGQFGTYIGSIYNYDVRSAYPSVMPLLPTLTNGKWRHIKGASAKFYSLIHVKWKFDARLHYFPFFVRDAQGSIYYPYEGEGWYWKPEIDAALRALNEGLLDTPKRKGVIELIESWEFEPYTDEKPFLFVQDLFKLRQRWKQPGPNYKPAEKVIKLGLNSLYGKTAQSLGGSEEKPPTFHNIGLAGFITSYIRAKIFDVIMQSPESIIMICTDGIYSTAPLDVEEGKSLGQWELARQKKTDALPSGVIAVLAGVYWGLFACSEPSEDAQKDPLFQTKYWQHEGQWYALNPHYRGFDKGTLYPEKVVKAWQTLTNDAQTLAVPSTRFVTLGSALSDTSQQKLWKQWRTWRTIERKLELLQNRKRVYTHDWKQPLNAHKSLIWTKAGYPVWGLETSHMSKPYKLKWQTGPLELIDGVDSTIVEKELEDTNE